MDLSVQELFGVVSVAISLWATFLYINSILKGQTRPHIYTWIVWAILPTIGFFAQLHDKAGAGAWATGSTAAACLVILALSFKYGDREHTKGDKIALVASLFAVVPWVLTKDPLGSVILISIIDLVAFYPTFRKSWLKPGQEHLMTFGISAAMMLCSIIAMENVTINTTLYPSVYVAGNTVFILYSLWRRKVMAAHVK